MKKLSILGFALIVSCASVTGPGNQDVRIDTTPSNAEILVDGRHYTSPAVVNLKGKSNYTIVASKKGYKDTYGTVKGEPRILAGVVGNMFNFTGIVGMAIDFFGTGAAYNMDENVNLTLRQSN